jgi:hypothetical protein
MKRLRGQERQGTSRAQYCKGDDRAEYITSKRLDDEKNIADYENPNHFIGGNVRTDDRITPIITPQKTSIIHPIVNLCEPYIESVFYQYDSFPHTNNEMIWHNDKIGRIVKFTYYLDSSMGDSVTVYLEKISPNGHVENLLNTPQNGNNYIKGTFNSQTLEFKINMKIKNDDMVRVRFINASATDCTIMANMDLKYSEEDFETN